MTYKTTFYENFITFALTIIILTNRFCLCANKIRDSSRKFFKTSHLFAFSVSFFEASRWQKKCSSVMVLRKKMGVYHLYRQQKMRNTSNRKSCFCCSLIYVCEINENSRSCQRIFFCSSRKNICLCFSLSSWEIMILSAWESVRSVSVLFPQFYLSSWKFQKLNVCKSFSETANITQIKLTYYWQVSRNYRRQVPL